MKDQISLLHNSHCSKSRCAIDFLTEKRIDFTIIEYLKDVPSKKELQDIIQKSGIKPEVNYSTPHR